MTVNYEKIGEGYYYNLWSGKLREYKGNVFYREGYTNLGYKYPEKSHFMAMDEHGRCVKKIFCSHVEGEITNKGLWLRESNPSRAAKLLIEYEETQIAKLKFQIRNHEDLIESLKEELV